MNKRIKSIKNVGVGGLLDWDYGFFEGTFEEYAQELDLPLNMVKNLFDNKVVVTDEIADILEKKTGIDKHIILRMDKNYHQNQKETQPVYSPAPVRYIKEM